MADEHNIYPVAEDRNERDGRVVIWENPDVPDHREVYSDGTLEFFCPDPECGDKKIFEDFTERDQLIAYIESHDGTHRCDDCNEPLYGIFGDGDHDG